jgi:hypothetical protein
MWALGTGMAGTRHEYRGHEHGGTSTGRGGTADSSVNVARRW